MGVIHIEREDALLALLYGFLRPHSGNDPAGPVRDVEKRLRAQKLAHLDLEARCSRACVSSGQQPDMFRTEPESDGAKAGLRQFNLPVLRNRNADAVLRIHQFAGGATSRSTKFIDGEPIKPATKRLAGRRYTSIGAAACWILPPFMTTILLPIVIASA